MYGMIRSIIVVSVLALASICLGQGAYFVCGEPDSTDYSARYAKLLEKSGFPTDVRVVYVDFQNNSDTGFDEDMRTNIWTEFAAFFARQSQDSHQISWSVVANPDTMDSVWTADSTAAFYGDEARVIAGGNYDEYYDFDPHPYYWYMGELQAEILLKIQAAYQGMPNPLDGADALLFVYIPYGGENPISPGVGGYAQLNVKKDLFPVLANFAYDPGDEASAKPQSEWRPCGTTSNWWGSPDSDWSLKTILAHEYAHVLGLGHLDSGSYGRCSGSGTQDSYYYGPYGLMRRGLLGGRPFQPLHEVHLRKLGWLASVEIASDTTGLILHDIRSGGDNYSITIPGAWRVPETGGSYFEYTQGFDLAFHAGSGDDGRVVFDGGPMYRSRGVAIWHWIGSQPINYPGGPYPISYSTHDLETSTGRYSDFGTWLVPDPQFGFDNMDVPMDRSVPCVSQCGTCDSYAGSSSDFFAAGDTFSYSTNPSTYGSESGVGFSGNQFRHLGQTVANSIVVSIREDYGDSIAVDILFAPREEVLSPSGGEVYVVGDTVSIDWSREFTIDQPVGIIDLVDVYFEPGGGLTPFPVAVGVDATLGSYKLVLDSTMAANDGRVYLVFHNINDVARTGKAHSVGTFSVLEPPVFVDRSLNDLGQEQIPYQKLPYSSVSINYDNAGPRDLAISFLNDLADVYKSSVLAANGGIPLFVQEPNPFAAGDDPDDLLGLAVGDVDSDGDEDFFASSQSSPRLYRKESDGKFHDMSTEWGVSSSMLLSTAGSWADYDRDGDIDLLIGTADCYDTEPGNGGLNGSVQDALLRNDLSSSGGFTDVSAAAGMVQSNSSSVTWVDINNDGYSDAFIGEILEPVAGGSINSHLFVNQRDGTFVDEMATRVGTFASCRGAIWRDIDADGDMDLEMAASWCRRSCENDGTGNLSTVSSEITSPIKPYSGLRLFDHDLDGLDDVLLLPSAVDDKPRMLLHVRESGTSTFQNISGYVGIDMVGKIGGAVAVDMNNDGDTDLFLGRDAPRDAQGYPTNTASEYLFQSAVDVGTVDQPENHWLGLRLSSPSTRNNRLAIGARASLTVNGQPRIKYVDGGSGRGGQDDLTLVFGLGDSPVLGDLVIDWPNAHQQTVPAAQLMLDMVHYITDDSPFGMVPGSITMQTQIVPVTFDLDWIFTWETTVWTNPALDRVTFNTNLMTPACSEGLTELRPGLYGVEHTVTAVPGTSRQIHQITWRNRPCVSKCSISYRVHSKINNAMTSSSIKTGKVGFCVQ